MVTRNRVLVTGGSGLLGRELQNLLNGTLFPDKNEFNITDLPGMRKYLDGKKIDLCLHAAAFTSPPLIDKDPGKALNVNIIGTSNVVSLCMEKNIKLIYISTDYVFTGDKGNYKEDDPVYPVNKYAWSKLGGECAVRLYENSIIIRTTFGPNVFPYEKAFVDQWTSRESVNMIAKKIVALVDVDFRGTVHVGGKRKTVYEYAKSLVPTKDIKELRRNEVEFSVPADTSLDCSKYKSIV